MIESIKNITMLYIFVNLLMMKNSTAKSLIKFCFSTEEFFVILLINKMVLVINFEGQRKKKSTNQIFEYRGNEHIITILKKIQIQRIVCLIINRILKE